MVDSRAAAGAPWRTFSRLNVPVLQAGEAIADLVAACM
jgi:hypothetical protein